MNSLLILYLIKLMIDPKRSTFKKTTEKYLKDNIFDIINIEETLLKPRILFKTELKDFLYNNLLEEYKNKKKVNTLLLNKKDAIARINQNNLNINIEDLYIITEKGNQKLIDYYYPNDFIGYGAFSIVISVYDVVKNENFALIIIPKVRISNDDYLDREIAIQSRLNHPNLLQLYNVVENDEYVYIFLELMEGGSLKDLIIERYHNKEEYLFTDEECSSIMKGLLEGINSLHSMNIMHRDIKPDNIMFKKKHDITSLKICDFGLAIHSLDNQKSQCGTVLFMSPEIINKQTYDMTIDIWAAGIILYILCSGGKHPIFYYGMESEKYIEAFNNKTSFGFPENFALLARNLFLKMCKFNKQYRYDCFKCLKHPWITRNPRNDIPMTLIESCLRNNMIDKFKSVEFFII
jgi:calcium-dependent protein kinase